MCLIVDANKLAETFRRPSSEVARPILDWLFKKDGCLVYGGEKILKELERVGEASRSVTELARAGRARKCDDEQINAEHAKIVSLGVCRSDDPHVIALARISGARVLYSADQDLHQDFKNKELLDKPRGKIYQATEHSRALQHTSACKSQLKTGK